MKCLSVNDNKKVMGKTVDLEEKGKRFLKFINEVQEKVESRGLTEEILNEILNDKS